MVYYCQGKYRYNWQNKYTYTTTNYYKLLPENKYIHFSQLQQSILVASLHFNITSYYSITTSKAVVISNYLYAYLYLHIFKNITGSKRLSNRSQQWGQSNPSQKWGHSTIDKVSLGQWSTAQTLESAQRSLWGSAPPRKFCWENGFMCRKEASFCIKLKYFLYDRDIKECRTQPPGAANRCC